MMHSLKTSVFTQVRTLKTARKPKRIDVQLLKDFRDIGKRGEIVSVMPCVMTNKLYRNNGAAYLLKGQKPPIPVVLRTEKLAVKESRPAGTEQKPREEEVVVRKAKKFSLEDLTGISKSFDYSLKTEKAQDESLLEKIRELPPTLFLKAAEGEQYNLQHISKQIYNYLGHSIPTESLKLAQEKDGKLEPVEATSSFGRYRLSIKIGNNKPVTVSLSVTKKI